MFDRNSLRFLLSSQSSRKPRHAKLRIDELEDRRNPAGWDLLQDINPTPNNVGSEPGDFVKMGSHLYFTARTATTGEELWKTDGTAAGTVLVKDVDPGTASSGIFNLTNVNGTLFFGAYDSVNGLGLWKSDGSAAGTTFLKSLATEPGFFFGNEFASVDGTLFFSNYDETNGHELWMSNGTVAGTTLVKDIVPGTASSNLYGLVGSGDKLYFLATTAANGLELWTSDGTGDGTKIVQDIVPGADSSNPGELTDVNGELFFTTTDPLDGRTNIWKTDGSAAGTDLVKNIQSAFGLFNVGGTVYMTAGNAAGDDGLWKTNGTEAGTVFVAPVTPGTGALGEQFLASLNGNLLFSAFDPANGESLWTSDGSAAGTIPLKNVSVSYFETGATIGNTLYFTAYDPVNGGELWKTDGTVSGTVLVKDINAGDADSAPSSITNLNGTLIFGATTLPDFGFGGPRELWKSNGTEAGTVLLKDLAGGTEDTQVTSRLTVNDVLYFSAFDPIHGEELWKTDGTEAGTTFVKDIQPGVNGSTLTNFTNVNGTLYFTATTSANGVELWKSNGTEAGTVLVKDIVTGSDSSNPSFLTNLNGTLYFSAEDPVNGVELWKSNGTEAGTTLVKDIYPGAIGSFASGFVNLNGVLYFSAITPANGGELWRTDGTPEGTTLVKDIVSGVVSSGVHSLTNVNNLLLFSAQTSAAGTELWRSDGTADGTFLLKDIQPGNFGSVPFLFTKANDTLFFLANTPAVGYELWKSDGTADGTTLVKEIGPGPDQDLTVSYLTSVGGKVYFEYTDPVTGPGVWVSDGTEAGTMLLKSIAQPVNDFFIRTPYNLTNIDGAVYFSATDAIHGEEVWTTDGTTAGTVPFVDIVSGSGGASPEVLGSAGGRLVVSAVTEAFGRELLAFNADAGPFGLDLSASTVEENKASGTTVGTFSPEPGDPVDTYTYSLVSGVGDADNGSFTLVSGVLRTAASFNFETKSVYSIRVKSQNSGGASAEEIFVITVTNVNETPTDIELAGNLVAENSAVGTTVGLLSVIDPDGAGAFAYELVAGANDNASFTLDGNILKTAVSFNFEAKSAYSVRVKSTDAGGLPFEKVIDIGVGNVNETPTDLSLSKTKVAENQPIGTIVGTFTTADPDGGDTFDYELITGDGSDDNASFTVDGDKLKTAEIFSLAGQTSYAIRVKSTDALGLTVEKALTITITPVNAAPTDILLSANSIAENTASGATVGTFSTTDSDVGDTFTYEFVTGVGGEDNASFTFDGNALKTAASFNFESKSSYSILVKSTDSGDESTQKTFVITVNNVNEAPTLNTAPTIVLPVVPRSSTKHVGQLVSTLLASAADPDAATTLKAAVTGFGGILGTWEKADAQTGPWTTLATGTDLNPTQYVRFKPKAGVTGYAQLQFKVTDGLLTSADTEIAWVPVGLTTPKYDAQGRVILTGTKEDTAAPVASVAKNALGFLTTEFTATTKLGLAVTAVGGNGKWQVKVGTDWVAITGVSLTNARLVKPTDSIRFLPDPNWFGDATITYRAWKVPAGTLPANPGHGNVLTEPASFSVQPLTAVVTVTPVNDAPTLDDISIPRLFTLGAPTDVSTTPQSVATLIAGASDVDSTIKGIAITRVAGKNGYWEYRKLATDTVWTKITGVSAGAALLLDTLAEVRFTQMNGVTSATGSFDYKIWDGSGVGVSGNKKPSTTTAFSKLAETATYSLGNRAPEFKTGKDPVFPAMKVTAKPVAHSVALLTTRMTDPDKTVTKGVAISALTGNGLWEYKLLGDTTWRTVNVTGAKLLLRSTDSLRFTPAAGQTGTATLTYHAWDQTTGGAGDRLTGDSDAISGTTLTASLLVRT